MGIPSTSSILKVWDAGSGQDDIARALLMLSLDERVSASTDPGDLGIGARDGMLLDLRSRMFGSRVESVNTCEVCGVQLRVAFDIADIRVSPPESPVDHVELTCQEYEIAARLPTTEDLVAIRNIRDIREARDRLLTRCVIGIGGRGDGMEAIDLPVSIQSEITRALADADPQAQVELLLQCAACGHERQVCFDIVRFLWAEIEEYGLQALRQVHQLARAYGWTEQETLALTPQRRRRYLEMVSDG